MGQTSGQIEQHIYQERGELGENISALENKVKAAVDWRHQTCARPFTALSIAFVGGILLAAFLPTGRGRRARSRRQAFGSHSGEARASRPTEYERHPSSDLWERIKTAFVGVATSRLQDILAEAIPGFGTEFSRTESRRTTSATHKAPELAESVYRHRPDGPTSDWYTHS